MKKLLAAVAAFALLCQPAQANFTFPNASAASITAFAFDGSTTPAGTSNCASTTECGASVPITVAGLPLFTSTNAGYVTGSGGTFPVTGTFWQTTQPVSGTFWQTTQPVSGTFWQTTQPVSAASLPLPSNAAAETGGNLATTATNTGTVAGAITSSVMQENVKQVNGSTTPVGAGAVSTVGTQRIAVGQDTSTIAGSAPGAAGTASANVLSVQGIASMTHLLGNLFGNAGATMDTTPGGSAATNALQIQGVASMTPLLANPGTAANWGLFADNVAWSVGTTLQVPLGCEYTSGGATALTTAHMGTPGCTSTRGLFTDKSSVAGTALGAVVSALGTLASGTPNVENVNAYIVGGGGSGGTSSSFGSSYPSTGTAAGAEYLSSPPSLTTGQMVALQVTSAGSLHTTVDNTLSSVEWNADGVANTTTGSPTTSLLMASNGSTVDRLKDDANKYLIVDATGAAASGAAVAGNPVLIAGSDGTDARTLKTDTVGDLYAIPSTLAGWGLGATGAAVVANAHYLAGDAQSSEPAATTTGYLTGAFFDLAGKEITSPYSNRENQLRGTGSSTTTSAITILAAGGSGLKGYLTDISCTRSDAGTTAISITLSDSSAMVLDLPDNGGGGGYTKQFTTPLVSSAANTAITATPSAGVTTLHCSGQGFKGY